VLKKNQCEPSYISGDEYNTHYKQKLLDNSKVKTDQHNLMFVTQFHWWQFKFGTS